jgi:hypothetical protein
MLSLGCGRIGYGAEGGTTRISQDEHVVKDNVYAIAGIEDGFAVAWAEYPPGSTDYQVMLALTDHDGSVTEGPRTVVEAELNPAADYIAVHQRPDLGIDVVFIKGEEVCLARLDSVGSVIMLYEWPLAEPITAVFFVPHPTGYAMLSSRRISGTYKVHLQWLSETGEPVGTELQLDTTGGGQLRAKGIFDGEAIVAIWVDTSGEDRVRHARILLDGTIAIPATTLLDDGTNQQVPEMAWTGTHAVVSFAQADVVKTLGLMPDGTVWPTPLETMPMPRRESPDIGIAATPDAAVLVGEYDLLSPMTQTAYTSFDPSDSSFVPTEPAELSNNAWSYYYPRIAAGSSSFGAIFRGDVEGSRRLLLSVVRP